MPDAFINVTGDAIARMSYTRIATLQEPVLSLVLRVMKYCKCNNQAAYHRLHPGHTYVYQWSPICLLQV